MTEAAAELRVQHKAADSSPRVGYELGQAGWCGMEDNDGMQRLRYCREREIICVLQRLRYDETR